MAARLNLNKMNLSDLKAWAVMFGIEIGGRETRDELMVAIRQLPDCVQLR